MGGKHSQLEPRQFIGKLSDCVYSKEPSLPSFEHFKIFVENDPNNVRATDSLGHNPLDLVMFSYKNMMISNREAETWDENSFHHHRDVLELLLQYESQADAPFGEEKLTPLHEAVQAGKS